MLRCTRTVSAGRLAAILVLGLVAVPSLAQKSLDRGLPVAPAPRPVADRNAPAAPQADAPQPPAPVQPDLVATYQGPVAKELFAFKWKEKSGNFTRAVCRMGWEVPTTELSTAGLDRNFGTYCAEALVGVVAGRTYRFEIQMPEVPEMYGLPDTVEGRAQADRRAKYLRELYGRYYLGSLREEDPDATRAFQAAVWEIVHESQLIEPQPAAPVTTIWGIPVGPAPQAQPGSPFSLFGGNFQADYPAVAQAPPFVQRAEQYLQSLTGNDNLFWQNLPGRELVRLRGLPGAAGEAAAQAQLALRYTRGGAPGYNGATAAASGPVGFAPVGGGAGGLGGPVGGGFPFVGGGGGSSGPSSIVPFVPTTTSSTSSSGGVPPNSITNPPVTPPVVVPPINTPPITTPPITTPPTPTPPVTTPIPAPPGVLLGGILLGAYVGRRILAKLRRPEVQAAPAV